MRNRDCSQELPKQDRDTAEKRRASQEGSKKYPRCMNLRVPVVWYPSCFSFLYILQIGYAPGSRAAIYCLGSVSPSSCPAGTKRMASYSSLSFSFIALYFSYSEISRLASSVRPACR